MSIKEANAIIDSINENEISTWEKTRWLAYVNALTAGAKLTSPEDLIQFSWEIKEESNKDIRTQKEIEQASLDYFNAFLNKPIDSTNIVTSITDITA